MNDYKLNAMLLVNKNCDFAYNLRNGLLKYGCEVSYVNTFDELINKLLFVRSSILFFSKDTMQEFKTISKLATTDLFNKCTIVYVGSETEYEEIKDMVNGANFFFCSSTQVSLLVQNIINQYKLTSQSKATALSVDKLNSYINDYLTKLGFTQKWIGFKFIKESLLVCINHNYSIGSLLVDVYPYVATKNNTTPYNVERSIRNAITKAYELTGFKNSEFEEFTSGKRKITNRLFLACMLDKLDQDKLREELQSA